MKQGTYLVIVLSLASASRTFSMDIPHVYLLPSVDLMKAALQKQELSLEAKKFIHKMEIYKELAGQQKTKSEIDDIVDETLRFNYQARVSPAVFMALKEEKGAITAAIIATAAENKNREI